MSHSVVLDRIKDSPAVKWLDSAANNAVKWPGYGLGVLNKIFNLEAPKHKDKPFKDFMDKVNQYFDGKSKIPVRVSKNDFVTNNLV